MWPRSISKVLFNHVIYTTASLQDLLPGTYHIYVNAYDDHKVPELRTAVFVDPFTVSIYLGDGLYEIDAVDTLGLNVPGGSWFYVS
jgi:hypothetical protein